MQEPEQSEVEEDNTLDQPESDTEEHPKLRLKIPAMVTLRSKSRNSGPSGSEYSAGAASASGSNNSPVNNPAKGGAEDDGGEEDVGPKRQTRSGRSAVPSYKESEYEDDDDEDEVVRTGNKRRTRSRKLDGFIATEDDEPQEDLEEGRKLRRRVQKKPSTPPKATRPTRRATRARAVQQQEDDYVDEGSPEMDQEESVDFDAMDAPPTSPEAGPEPEPENRTYGLRARPKINYAIPPPLEEMRPAPSKLKSRPKTRQGPGWSATGAELSRYMGIPADDSDSDGPTRTPGKRFGAGAGMAGGAGGLFAGASGGMLASDLAAAAGTPSNLGKIGDAGLSDSDPLGVNTNVTFDEVGGLDEHINQLKEMTVLPLLYPEVFQRFNITPPRGVLFHGPPGTGKTLLARALAASCRSNGKKISFYMRKGADALSKWVGEAERQLRLLFEEARNSQPSIIFFDEIDGLAPVRSSKQDQIHASIVSTLLALMDGMDGRGQVIVIGATNRPDAIDPALRRPGRFDREFYFPLPSLAAREKILGIMTRKWEGWDEEKATETIQSLARATKGYGGADLRALCTEAALNAIQRRYPQVYQSDDRLLLKPETINVQARDFMITVKKLIPSSARSASSTAAPLPQQFVPLLSDTLEKVKEVLNKSLPMDKKRSALEEAQWDDGDDDAALERELLLQSMETLRVHRPRVVLHGVVGMGQGYVGAAALHHLEGYHVQSLDLGALLGDSTRTVEAAIVQLFVEAKRHQPAIIYIPSLTGWCAAVSETSRSTVRAMLDTLSPTDPVLLLAVVDGSFTSLPKDVRAWFGVSRENRVALSSPSAEQRDAFFKDLLENVRRPPNLFPDGIKRKKRILEVLPVAPPIEPKAPTAAELAVQEENDQRVITLLKYRLGPILTELKRKHKRFTKRAADEYNLGNQEFAGFFGIQQQQQQQQPDGMATTRTRTTHMELAEDGHGYVEIVEETTQELPNGHTSHVNGPAPRTEQPQAPAPAAPAVLEVPPIFDVDLERIHQDLYKGKYLTPSDFLEDIGKIVHNAEVRYEEDPDRLYKAQAMYTAAEVSIQEFDAPFRLECERMAVRERQRRDEYKKLKNKGKGKDHGNVEYAPGTRRSARNTGQEPEFNLGDLGNLEKRKRQRSSEESRSGSAEEGGPAAKRSRLSASEDDDTDPLDVIGPTASQTRTRDARNATSIPGPSHMDVSMQMQHGAGPTVRFSNDLEQIPSFAPHHGMSNGIVHDTSAFSHATHHHQHQHPQRSGGLGMTDLLNPMPPPSMHNHTPFNQPFGPPSFPNMSGYSHEMPHPDLQHYSGPSDVFGPINPPMFPSGHLPQQNLFDPSLSQGYPQPSFHHLSPHPPFLQFPHHLNAPPQQHLEQQFQHHQPQPHVHQLSPVPQAQQAPPIEQQFSAPEAKVNDPGPTETEKPVAAPMETEIERTPTPLPPFELDERSLANLQASLRDDTSALNVEQLEQLRATALGCVWRRRSDWNRADLIRELGELVKEFLEEVDFDLEDHE